MKKVKTSQARASEAYKERMLKAGMHHIKVWVPGTDLDKVKAYCGKLRAKYMRGK